MPKLIPYAKVKKRLVDQMTKTLKQKCETEYSECRALASYLDDLVAVGKVVCFSHTSAGTNTPFIGTRMKAKASGLRKGLPDFFIILNQGWRSHLIAIELKRVDKSLSHTYPEQELWQKALKNAGIDSYIVYGSNEAIKIIEKYL